MGSVWLLLFKYLIRLLLDNIDVLDDYNFNCLNVNKFVNIVVFKVL